MHVLSICDLSIISSSDFNVILLLKKLNVWIIFDMDLYTGLAKCPFGFSLRSYRDPNELCGQPNTWEVPREGDCFSIILA